MNHLGKEALMTKEKFIKMLTAKTTYKYSNFTYLSFFYGEKDGYAFYFKGDRFSPFYLYFSLVNKNNALTSQIGDRIVEQLSTVDGHSLNGYCLCLRLKKVKNENILNVINETISEAITIFKKEDYQNCCEVDGQVGKTTIATYGKKVGFYNDKWLKIKGSELKEKDNKGSEKPIFLILANFIALFLGSILIYLFSNKAYILLPAGLGYGLIATKAYTFFGGAYSLKSLFLQALMLLLSVVIGCYMLGAYYLVTSELVSDYFTALTSIPRLLNIGNFFYMQLLWLYLFSLVTGVLLPYLKIKNLKKDNYLWILK